MVDRIEAGQMAFVSGSTTAIGAIRGVAGTAITIYVENSGDFRVPIAAVTSVHDGKVMLDTSLLEKPFLAAVGHGHDREVPDVAG